jgi:phage gpG-like protein
VAGDDLRVRIDSNKLPAVVADFVKKGGNLGELTPLIAEQLHEAVTERFETESGFEQGKWKPRQQLVKRGGVHPLLRDTGVLYGSLTPESDPESAQVFTNVPYAIYHMSHQPRTKMPLRDFFDIDWNSVTEYAADLILSEMVTGS